MSPERWQRVVQLFEAAVALPRSQRTEFLAMNCGADNDLRSEVEAMVAADEVSLPESDSVHWNAFSPVPVNDAVDRNIGRRVGKYRIVREIGRGGMGAVYEAQRSDDEFRQRVAIKLVKRGMDTDLVLRRFRQERQILANLNHPFIARLLDGGTTDDGLPYLVMEYVDGVRITDHCENAGSPLSERLELVLKVCDALNYAHQEQVVHRDIKPGNIIVTADGQVKLLDFGISKLLSASPADTATGRLMMTPDYASPEQMRGGPAGPASDIYSLGVLLYRLVTGELPNQASGSRRLESGGENYEAGGPQIDPGLDAIVLKALRRDPRERYASVADLAADLENFLCGRPVTAESATTKTYTNVGAAKAIAVLPFKFQQLPPEGQSVDRSYLGLGLTDALITRLANVRSLTVRPTSSVVRYGCNEAHDLFDVGRELDVTHVLDGRVTLVGDRMRVMVQLVSVAERSSLWAHQYNEELTDFFAVQDSISAQVAAALETELTDQERSGLARRATESPVAYEAYLRGRAIWHSYTEEGMAAAIRYFRTAAELDPGFGAAHSGIADIHIALGISSVMPPGEAFAIAKASAKKAIELDPRSAEAYASLGFAVWATDWDAARSEELFERSFLLNENYAAAYEWFAHVLASQMRFEEAIGLMKRALRIDPNSSQLYAMTAYILHNARRAHEAVFYIERSVELDPENYIGLQGFGWIYPAIGRTREAIPYCRKALEISGHAPFCVWTLAQVLAQAGERAEAESLLEQLKRISSTRYVSPYYAAMVNTTFGRYDEAFKSLEKAFDDHDYWAQWLPVEYRFDPIRGDDRYAKLIDRLGRERKGKSGVEPPGTVDPAARAPRTIRAAAVVLLLVIAGGLGGIFLIKGRTAEQGGVEPRIKVTRVTSEGSVMYSAISPDGSSTVYVKEEGGRQSVWTKRIGSANSELLIAPSDLKFAAPTYSPDGRTLYYVAQRRDRNTGTLYAMPAVAGGQSRKIIEDVYGKVDIAPDGRQIAFRRRRLDPSEDSIFVAGEDRSNPKLIASRKYPGTLTNPSFSPDGKTLAYGAVNAGEEGSEQYATITLSPLNGGPARDVGGKRWSMLTYVAWRPDGKGLYVAGQENIDSANIQIWQVSLDGSQYTRLTNDAENYRGISAARGSAALLTVKSELTSSMWIVPDPSDAPDERKADRLSAGSLAGFRGLAWAPNGSIVYTVYENSVVEIWRADADGSNPRRLIRRAGDSYLPAISPDGRYVVYVSEEQGAPDLWRLDLNGGENIQLTRGGGDRSPQFTADGRTIVFTRVVAGRRVLAKMPVEGREAQQIGDFAADMPAISPDGRTIAFLLVDDSGGRIALMPVDGDRPTKIFDIPLSVAARPYHSAVLRWSSDGGAVAYIHDQNGPPNVWAQPVNGGSPRQITFFNTGEIFYFDFARDGRLALAQGMQVSDAVLFSIGD